MCGISGIASLGLRNARSTIERLLEWLRGNAAADLGYRYDAADQRVLKVQCQAELAFDYQPAGLHFSMRAPLPEQRIVPAY